MKRGFILFFLLLLPIIGGRIGYVWAYSSCSYRNNHSYVSRDGSILNMNENSPAKKQVLVLFRKGIEEKNISVASNSNGCLVSILEKVADSEASVKDARGKQAVSFFHSFVVSHRFLCSFSFRPPPAAC